MSIAFDRAFEAVIGVEDGYVDHPLDKGGPTKWGISYKSYPYMNIKDLSVDQAKGIYKRDYWDKLGLDTVRDYNIATEIFDTGVNMGIMASGKITQTALNYLGSNLKVDGLIGPKTLKELNRYPYPRDLVKALNGVQFAEYLDIVKGDFTQKVFARGWLKRVIL